VTGCDYSESYDPDADFDRYYTLATARAIAPQIQMTDTVIELGSATALMAASIISLSPVAHWLGIDRSETYLEKARARHLPNAEFVKGDLNDLPPLDRRFDHVLATNVLHEVADPHAFLAACRDLIGPAGKVHLTLQNPSSIHRLAALEMGLIESLTEVASRGAQWGTTRLWSADDLSALAEQAGLNTMSRAGVLLKPLPNADMEKFAPAVIDGFERAARYFPEHCAMNYLVFGHA
jgi:ubiquinone/menaquinone biosynthesis C-methylase UbiE